MFKDLFSEDRAVMVIKLVDSFGADYWWAGPIVAAVLILWGRYKKRQAAQQLKNVNDNVEVIRKNHKDELDAAKKETARAVAKKDNPTVTDRLVAKVNDALSGGVNDWVFSDSLLHPRPTDKTPAARSVAAKRIAEILEGHTDMKTATVVMSCLKPGYENVSLKFMYMVGAKGPAEWRTANIGTEDVTSLVRTSEILKKATALFQEKRSNIVNARLQAIADDESVCDAIYNAHYASQAAPVAVETKKVAAKTDTRPADMVKFGDEVFQFVNLILVRNEFLPRGSDATVLEDGKGTRLVIRSNSQIEVDASQWQCLPFMSEEQQQVIKAKCLQLFALGFPKAQSSIANHPTHGAIVALKAVADKSGLT